MSCQCDYSFTCDECQNRIDIELEKTERLKWQNKVDARLKKLEELLLEVAKRGTKSGHAE